MNKFAFLSSPRFWQLFLIGASAGLNFPFPDNPWVQGFAAMVGIWFGGSVVVGSNDRNADKRLQASILANSSTTVSMPSGVTEVKATTKE